MMRVTIENQKAFEKFKELVAKQGGDVSYIDDVTKFRQAQYIEEVTAKKSGTIMEIDTEMIGKVSSYIGAGRLEKDDKIDPEAGIVICKKLGEQIKKGDVIAYVHTNRKDKVEEAIKDIQESYNVSALFKKTAKTVIETIK